ncbi:LPS-assembly lipoprotein RlpB precursor (Rare lipoprotein B) [Pseudoalteromonas luteoviolacea B = ATCC 29581]|nr:LPS-assembly lipoprotein RlpB precursor (Rare lipoprotein B) [Pseudoalteromonas luteoviolacea B = ATCC 29581]
MPTLLLRYSGLALFALGLLLLTGCGFQLKQASYIPADLRDMVLVAKDPKSALLEQLTLDLQRAQVNLTPKDSKTAAELVIVKDTLERQTLSLFKNGQVAQYELAYSVTYQLTRKGREPSEHHFELYRTYQDDPDQALAKSKEMELLLTELRRRASQRIIRQLSQL